MNESILFELLVVLFFFPICVGKILFWQLKKGIPAYHFYDYIAYFIYLVYCLIIHPHHNMNFTKAGVVGRVFLLLYPCCLAELLAYRGCSIIFIE